jgi:hypothetical protein
MADTELLTNLRQLMTKRFSDGELRTLCFDLGVEYDDLPGSSKKDKAREFAYYVDRHKRLPDWYSPTYYQDYVRSPVHNPQGPSSPNTERVMRAARGSWRLRGWDDPGNMNVHVGFCCARSC